MSLGNCGMPPDRDATAAEQIKRKGGGRALQNSFLPVKKQKSGPCPRCHLPTYHAEAQGCISALVSRDNVQQRQLAALKRQVSTLPEVALKQAATIKDLRQRLRYTNVAIKRALGLSEVQEP